jgi:Ca2+-binding RTX toxin-like protein
MRKLLHTTLGMVFASVIRRASARVFLVASTTVFAAAFGSSSAAAWTLAWNGTTVEFKDGNGDANDLSLFWSNFGYWEFRDFGAGGTVLQPCVIVVSGVSACANPSSFLIDFGGGGDRLNKIVDRSQYGGDPPFTIYGGSGNDGIYGNAGGNDLIDAGDGNDKVDPSDPDLFGITLGQGNDTVRGGNGDDIYLDGGNDNDLVEGGPGNDTVRDLHGTNNLYGQDGNDDVQGLGRVDGGPGVDHVSDEALAVSDDTLVGGPGPDTINGGWGSDTVYAQDGERDVIGCGEINPDTAYVDQYDVVTGCEDLHRVTVPPPGGGGGGGGGGVAGGGGAKPVSIFLSNTEAKQAGRRAVRRKFGRRIRGLALACSRQSNVRLTCKARFKLRNRRYWARVTITARKNSKGQESRRARVGPRHRA